jgi:hypothetical protein
VPVLSGEAIAVRQMPGVARRPGGATSAEAARDQQIVAWLDGRDLDRYGSPDGPAVTRIRILLGIDASQLIPPAIVAEREAMRWTRPAG